MRRNSLTTLLLVLAAGCSPATTSLPQGERATVEAAARAMGEALLEALNAHEVDRILAFYDRGDDFTYVACTRVMRGGAGLDPVLRALHHATRDDAYEMDIARVRVVDRTAAVLLFEGTFTGPLFVSRLVEKGADGAWRITYEHESWPGCEGPDTPHPGTAPGDTVGMGITP